MIMSRVSVGLGLMLSIGAVPSYAADLTCSGYIGAYSQGKALPYMQYINSRAEEMAAQINAKRHAAGQSPISPGLDGSYLAITSGTEQWVDKLCAGNPSQSLDNIAMAALDFDKQASCLGTSNCQ